MSDKTVQLTFVEWKVSGLKVFEFTKGEIIWFSLPKKLFIKDIINWRYLSDIFNNTWIYFLNWEKIYIWQAINLYKRIKDHAKDSNKDFNEIICFTTTDNSLGEWDINYLEKTIIKLARRIDPNALTNMKEWNKWNIKEYRKSDINWYIEEIKFLLSILWFNFLEELVEKENFKNLRDLFFIEKKWVNAKMIYNEKWYILLKWSYGKHIEANSMWNWYKKLKRELIEKWIILVEDDDKIIFTQDYNFSSATAPAQILCGYSVSWPEYRQNKNWEKMKDIDLSLIE